MAEEKRQAELRRQDAGRKAAEERKREEERKRREAEERKRREEEARTKERVFRVGGVEFKMIRVEGGTFMMGSPDSDSDAYDDEKPQHRVTLSDYYIGEIPVTQALWQAVMGGNPSYSQRVNNPVECVSWNDCQEFLKKLNQQTGMTFSLPTEAQWEYAARGGNKSKGYKYAGSNSVKDVAWYTDNSGGMTHPVKGKRANEPRTLRHEWQCVGMVSGLVRQLQQHSADKSHWACYQFDPCASWRQLGRLRLGRSCGDPLRR